MAFEIKDKKLNIEICSKECILKKYLIRKNEFQIKFAGASKECTSGLKIDNSFIVQKSAESWDGKIHDFGITVNRDEIVKNNIVLNKIRYIRNDNLLKIRDICSCSVELEYIDGYILNAKKGSWILGEHAYERDYLDVCSKRQFVILTKKILGVVKLLHRNSICHTDVMNHNIMIRKSDEVPILIDLIGAMPYSERLADLDKKVFLEYVVLDGCRRLGLYITDKVMMLQKKNGKYDFEELFECLDEMELQL